MNFEIIEIIEDLSNEAYHDRDEILFREEWRDIECNKYYDVSNLGRVRSWKNNRFGRSKNPRILKPQKHNGGTGYYSVCLSYGSNGTKFKLIHRLVATAFIPNYDNKKEVNHIDGDGRNNHVSNLEWATHAENIKHAHNTGLKVELTGAKRHNSKLNEDQVRQIRYIYNNTSITTRMVAKKFNISASTAWSVVSGKTYKEIA